MGVDEMGVDEMGTYRCDFTCRCFFLSAGRDYLPISSTRNLTSSTAMVAVLIPIIDDSVVESNEQFTVVLSSSDPNVLTSVNQATVTIVNDDCKFSTPREAIHVGANVHT